MNDIYKQKAKKYKYKYLKLKNDYIGGARSQEELKRIHENLQLQKQLNNQQLYNQQLYNQQLQQRNNVNFEYIGFGGFGCIISPPVQFNIQNYNKDNILYPPNKIINNEIYKDKKYIGKLLSCDKGSFQIEINEFLKINKIDPEAKHRSQLIFAAYYNRKELTRFLRQQHNDEQITKLWYCLNEKQLLKYEHNKDIPEYTINLDNPCNAYNNYGYIISTRVGKSFDKINLNQFNKDQIITILINLKASIKDLIVKLYDDGSIHGDIKLGNMTLDLDNNYKVSFIDFGFVTKINEIINIRKISGNHQYFDIILIFMKIIDRLLPFFDINNMTSLDLITKIKLINRQMTKYELIELINNNPKNGTILPHLLKHAQLSNINYSNFFKSIDDKPHYLIDFYTLCIVPIIKNIDIYALSLFIHQLFYKIWFETFNSNYINQDTQIKLSELLRDALYNNINGPYELIIYLDAIINSLRDKYSLEDIEIKNKIIQLRNKQREARAQARAQLQAQLQAQLPAQLQARAQLPAQLQAQLPAQLQAQLPAQRPAQAVVVQRPQPEVVQRPAQLLAPVVVQRRAPPELIKGPNNQDDYRDLIIV
jgi:hypothetical protein